jgi:hypothetical protein
MDNEYDNGRLKRIKTGWLRHCWSTIMARAKDLSRVAMVEAARPAVMNDNVL